MALAGRIRSTIPLISKALRSTFAPSLPCTNSSTSESLRSYATGGGQKEVKVKVPMALFGGSGNYASALYISAVKANVLDKVESELLDLVEASKKSPMFSQFTKDLSVPADTRVKAMKYAGKQNFQMLQRTFWEMH